MKTCPVCNAPTFDDMGVCFSCMHHYERNEAGEVIEPEELADAVEEAADLSAELPYEGIERVLSEFAAIDDSVAPILPGPIKETEFVGPIGSSVANRSFPVEAPGKINVKVDPCLECKVVITHHASEGVLIEVMGVPA